MSWRNFFTKQKKEDLDQGLEKTKQSFFNKIAHSVAGKSRVDEEVLDDLEEVLVSSDVSVKTTLKIIDRLEERVKQDKYVGVNELNGLLKKEISDMLYESNVEDIADYVVPKSDTPHVIMVVGVNGVGKTTTIGKLAHQFKNKGYNVVLGAADTFRAAAVEQLTIWSERVGVPIVKQKMGSDPASVAFDTLQSAKSNQADVVLIDWPLGKIVSKISKPVIIMDRSPPADSGILAKFQWRVWNKSWSNAFRGTVVSQAHREFVVEHTGTPSASIGVLPAGVDLELFQNGKKEDIIRLVYHGRVDVKRGVLSLPMILAGLQEAGVESSLHIYGKGDAVERLRRIGMNGLEVTDSLPQHEIAQRLSTYDVGILPMPQDKVWNLASPLKRSEYLASGLVVCGIDHTGHRIKDSGNWLQLSAQKDFIRETVDWLSKLERKEMTALQTQARKYAEENLSWSHSVDTLESMILS